MEYFCYYDSPLGGITLTGDGKALTGLWFNGQNRFTPGTDGAEKATDLPIFEQARRWLDAYFGGKAPDFTPPLALKGTAFRRSVWALLPDIPYGTTVSYGEIAKRLEAQNGGRRVSARAVGGAVGHNPVSIIVPCHRVIGADGSLTGYGGGMERKRRLLELEKIMMNDE